MANAWGGSWGAAWGSSWGTAVAGEVACNAEDVVSASFVSTPMLAVEGGEPVEPPLPMGGLSAGGYYRRRRDPEADEEREKQEERERRRRRDLTHAIDRAIARVRAELPEIEAPPEAGPPVPVAEIAAIDDGLAAVQDSIRTIEALSSRVAEADEELASLWLQAVALVEEAELVDDDEALELLLTGTVEAQLEAAGWSVDIEDEEDVLELLLAA